MGSLARAVMAVSLAAAASIIAPPMRAGATANYGTISITGAIRVSYTVAGLCSAHAQVLTSVTLRTQAENATSLTIAGSSLPPPGPVDLATTTTFNVEVEILSGIGAGGSWLAGYAGGEDLGSGSLAMSPNASFGSVEAVMYPYGGGSIEKPVQLHASWDCAGEATSPTTVPRTTTSKPASGNPYTRLTSHVPSSYFGCTSDPQLSLGGESIVFRYKAIAEVDCEVDGVSGVSLAIYMLYPDDAAMNAAFTHVWVDEVARPKSSLGCPQKSFSTAVCYYRVGNSKSAAGLFMRFMFYYPADPNPTPSVTWTSDRYGIISYLAGANPDDTQQVLDYWESGAPNPV
ncbi:MAG TPA: hypothetical protein VME20_00225 [Acidimicrobiales bacterium]|nr:hypothetical protein [Acidimicrobiales bacterium]